MYSDVGIQGVVQRFHQLDPVCSDVGIQGVVHRFHQLDLDKCDIIEEENEAFHPLDLGICDINEEGDEDDGGYGDEQNPNNNHRPYKIDRIDDRPPLVFTPLKVVQAFYHLSY